MQSLIDCAARERIIYIYKPARASLLCLLIFGLGLFFFGVSGYSEEEEPVSGLYRYRNAEGSLVIDYSIPPEYAEKGYDILSTNGILLKRVPPRAEMKTLSLDEQNALKEREKEDAYILATYRSLNDVEMARRRKLENIQREIDILKANLVDAIRRQGEFKDKAAAYQANGRQPPDTIIKMIDDLTTQEASIQQLMEERREEIGDMTRRFDRHAERLQELRPGLSGAPKAAREKHQNQ